MDTDEYIARICAAMKMAAFEMAVKSGDETIELLETLPADRVQEIVAEAMGQPDVSILPVLLNSVLVSFGNRQGSSLSVGFALRILQEYFAAAFLAENQMDAANWPANVREFARELSGPS